MDIVQSAPEVKTIDFLEQELNKTPEPEPVKEEALTEVPEQEGEQEDQLEIDDSIRPDIKDDELFIEPFKRSAVLKDYPDLFKKYPDLEKKLYRSEAYEEIFPTLDKAREAKDRVQTLESAEFALFSGNVEDILKSVRDEDKEAFYRLVDNFLPTVDRIDRGAHLQLIGNIGTFFIRNMLQTANQYGKDSNQGKFLWNAALALNQFLFGHNNVQEIKPLAKPVNEDDGRVAEREQQLLKQRFDEIQSDLIERSTNSIEATISKYIDPRDSMPEYVKKNAIKDCRDRLDNAIGSDQKFKDNLDLLWQRIVETDFSKNAQEAVKSAYFSKARTLLPDIIKQVRNEALAGVKGSPRKKQEINEEEPTRQRRATSAAPNRGQNEDGPRKGESTLDWINRVAK